MKPVVMPELLCDIFDWLSVDQIETIYVAL
jgi:hypothetical protein